MTNEEIKKIKISYAFFVGLISGFYIALVISTYFLQSKIDRLSNEVEIFKTIVLGEDK